MAEKKEKLDFLSKLRIRELILMGLITVTAVLANLPEEYVEDTLGISRATLVAMLGIAVIIGLFLYLRTGLFIAVVLLIAGANMPDQIAYLPVGTGRHGRSRIAGRGNLGQPVAIQPQLLDVLPDIHHRNPGHTVAVTAERSLIMPSGGGDDRTTPASAGSHRAHARAPTARDPPAGTPPARSPSRRRRWR